MGREFERLPKPYVARYRRIGERLERRQPQYGQHFLDVGVGRAKMSREKIIARFKKVLGGHGGYRVLWWVMLLGQIPVG
jgi:hypothetical protein